jgi:phosphoribosylformylglycinamidine synthase subunit PurQ / glutaminase
MKVGVIVFPGSNCDHDIEHVFGRVLGAKVTTLWHKDAQIGKQDLLVVPGGFSYGDYLRTGALAKLSPVMSSLKKFAKAGGPVIGICNGFQILCEAGILPGVLLQNVSMRFISKFIHIRVEQENTPFTRHLSVGSLITCPIAHGEGNFYASDEDLNRIEGEGQVVFRYADQQGHVSESDRIINPNGSARSIAGVCNKDRNVVGLMPHPERASEKLIGFIGSDTGRALLQQAVG